MSCKILYSAVLKFKPLKFSLYESRLSRILTKHHSRTTTASSQLEPPGARPRSSPCPAEGHPRPSGGREEDKDVAFRVITRAMSSCSVCSALGRQMGCYRVAGRFSGHSLCAQTHPLSSLQPPTAPHCQGQLRSLGTAPLPLTEHQPRTPSLSPTASCSPHI